MDASQTTSTLITLYLYAVPSFGTRKRKRDREFWEQYHDDTWLNPKDAQSGEERQKKGNYYICDGPLYLRKSWLTASCFKVKWKTFFFNWVKCTEKDTDAMLGRTYYTGTMESVLNSGIHSPKWNPYHTKHRKDGHLLIRYNRLLYRERRYI